ncbi:NrfD/PsrC family molybdoenzyme membrane anchor subunit [Thermoproteota archaeon]
MVDFIFPNNTEVLWTIMIVLYPYLSGSVVGVFIVGSLYKVFNMTHVKSVARLSLLTAISFLLIATLPLILHLTQPFRALEIFTTPQFNSAMAGFGIIYVAYLLILVAEIWFEFRKDIITLAISSKGLKKILYTVMSLGVLDLNEKDFKNDKKIVRILSFIGIPADIILFGYIGFLFGGIKSNPFWSTSLMPVIFLISAISAGFALIFLLYVISTKLRHKQLDYITTNSLLKWLFGFLVLSLSFQILHLIFIRYQADNGWPQLLILVTEIMPIEYFGIQMIVGGLIPLILIGLALISKTKSSTKVIIGFISSILISIGVFALRYNTVIGGQLSSSSMRGFSVYHLTLWGREGLLPFIVLFVLTYILPPWDDTPSEIKK